MRQLRIAGLVRVETEQSVWFIEPERYIRLPKAETPRRSLNCLDEALADAQWMSHRGVYEQHDQFGFEPRLRVLPAWRPDDSEGIVTGVIVAMTPPLRDCLDPSHADDVVRRTRRSTVNLLANGRADGR